MRRFPFVGVFEGGSDIEIRRRGRFGAGVGVVCMHRPSACCLYTYILSLEIHDGSAYRPSSGGLCTYTRAFEVRGGSAYRPSSC